MSDAQPHQSTLAPSPTAYQLPPLSQQSPAFASPPSSMTALNPQTYQTLVYQNMMWFANSILYFAQKGVAGKLTQQDSAQMKSDMQSLQLAMRLHEENAAAFTAGPASAAPPSPYASSAASAVPCASCVTYPPSATAGMQPVFAYPPYVAYYPHTGAADRRDYGLRAQPRQTCMHCGTDTTPIWRKGPMGPATLCNACGLKYMRANKAMQQMATQAKKSPVRSVGSPTRKSSKDLGAEQFEPHSDAAKSPKQISTATTTLLVSASTTISLAPVPPSKKMEEEAATAMTLMKFQGKEADADAPVQPAASKRPEKEHVRVKVERLEADDDKRSSIYNLLN